MVLADDAGGCIGILVIIAAVVIVVGTLIFIGLGLLAACAVGGALYGAGVAIVNFLKVVIRAHYETA